MPDRVGQQLGHYKLIRLLGKGASAEVYLGKHIHLGNQAAIKVLDANLDQRDQMNQFRAEARKLIELSHPHIVRVLDFGIEQGAPYLVMDYAPNGTLRQRHPRGLRLPLPIIGHYVQQIAAGLHYAHEARLVHRDIKPENILLGRRNTILISDFGIAVVTSTRSDVPQNVAGTVSYMAPEQLQGRPQRASDQYALGIMVYEWLTGAVPFHGTWLEIASQQGLKPPPPFCAQLPNLPPEVEEVVLTALAKDPKERFASIQLFADALMHASKKEPEIHDHAPLPEETPDDSVSITPLSPWRDAAPARDAADLITTPAFLPSPEGVKKTNERPPTDAHDPLSTVSDSSITVAAPPSAQLPALPKKITRKAILLLTCFLILLGGGTLGTLAIASKKPTAPASAIRTAPVGPVAGEVTVFTVPTHNAVPSAITLGPDGNLWFTETTGNRIGRITPAGAIQEFPIDTAQSNARGITTGPDGALWFTEYTTNKLGRITPQGVLKEFPLPRSRRYPVGIVAGPDGNLWFAEENANRIGRVNPQGTSFQEFSVPTPVSEPLDMTVGPDGAIWFTEFNANKIGRITLQGAFREFPIPTPKSGPDRIISGPDGNLWFTEFNANQLGRVTPAGNVSEFSLPTPKSQPIGITVGPDGNLWFAEGDGNQIGRITPTGTITEFPLPTANNHPNEIIAGPDKSLWFTEATSNQVGRITSGR